MSGSEIASSVSRLVREALASGVVEGVMIVTPVPVRECGSLVEVFQGAEAKEAGMAARLQGVAETLGCGFLAAGEHAEVSPVDGVHLDIKAHHALGEAAARAVVGFWES